jgi:hypothetical protein
MAKPNQPADPPMTSRHESHEWKTLDAKAPVFTCTRCWIDGGDPMASRPCPVNYAAAHPGTRNAGAKRKRRPLGAAQVRH